MSFFLRWPDWRLFFCQCSTNSHFSATLYVHLRPTCSPLTSTHINSHNCHSPSLLLGCGKHPLPPASTLSVLLNTTRRDPPPPFFSTELLANASHEITCYVQSQQLRDAAICWGHTGRDEVEWLAFWWPLWQPTDGMRVCFRTECCGLLLCHLSGRLQACGPWGRRPRNVFTPPKGTTRRNAWKDLAKWDFNLISDWALLFNSGSLVNLGRDLRKPLKNVNYLFVVWVLGTCKINSSYPILWLVFHVDTWPDTFWSRTENQQKYTSCWRSERKRGRREMGGKRRKGTSFPVTLSYLSSLLHD